LTIVTTGSIISNALIVADALENKGISVEVINASSIKPLDERLILSSVKKTGNLIVIEEHQKNGGLGGAISEIILEKGKGNINFKRMGLNDEFCTSYGWHKDLLYESGLSVDHIKYAVLKLINTE
jgi:transketolase